MRTYLLAIILSILSSTRSLTRCWISHISYSISAVRSRVSLPISINNSYLISSSVLNASKYCSLTARNPSPIRKTLLPNQKGLPAICYRSISRLFALSLSPRQVNSFIHSFIHLYIALVDNIFLYISILFRYHLQTNRTRDHLQRISSKDQKYYTETLSTFITNYPSQQYPIEPQILSTASFKSISRTYSTS